MIKLVPILIDEWSKVGKLEGRSKSNFFHAFTKKEDILKYLTESSVYFIDLEGLHIGSIGFKALNEKTTQLEGLNIIPEKRKMGYAEDSVKLLMQLIKNKGFSEVVLLTHPKNVSALNLYLKLGFTVVGYFENYFGDGEPRLKMLTELK